jgi:hypothetical protein
VSYFEPVTFSTDEAEELRALVWQAWEIKEQFPEHLSDAAAAIVEWRERLPLSRLERRQEREAAAA